MRAIVRGGPWDMRSLPYLMTGEPRCFADCVDYRSRSKLLHVRVELKADETPPEPVAIRRLLACFVWDFENKIVACEEQMGGIVLSEPPDRQRLSLDNANRRLKRRLDEFSHFGIELNGREARFTATA
jgi:hypothetical protein